MFWILCNQKSLLTSLCGKRWQHGGTCGLKGHKTRWQCFRRTLRWISANSLNVAQQDSLVGGHSFLHKTFESLKRRRKTFKSPQKRSSYKKGLLKVIKKVNWPKNASNSNKVTQKRSSKRKLTQKILTKSLKKYIYSKKDFENEKLLNKFTQQKCIFKVDLLKN